MPLFDTNGVLSCYLFSKSVHIVTITRIYEHMLPYEQDKCMTRLQKLVLISLGILILTFSMAVFLSQQQATEPTHTLNGQGIYESCPPSKGQMCWDRLQTIAQGG